MKTGRTGTLKIQIKPNEELVKSKMSKLAMVNLYENGDSGKSCRLSVSVSQDKSRSETTHMSPQVDTKSSSEEPKLSKEESQETRHLKELLLLHMDLIQQQQDLLLSKETQIHQLKQERETLRCRLQRMERRVSIVKQSPSRKEYTEVKEPVELSRSGQLQNKGVKRKLSLDPQPSKKDTSKKDINRNVIQSDRRHKSQPNESSSNSGSRTPLKRESLRSQSTPIKVENNLDSTSTSTKTPTGKSNSYSHSKSRNKLKQESDESKTKILCNTPNGKQRHKRRRKTPADSTIAKTEILYYVPLDENEFEITPKKQEKDEQVLVPTYRIQPVPTGYTMEGTENLDDEIFLKRHQKPEVDEKRRKRWDMQQMREQKMLEKLQASNRYSQSGTNSQESDQNFESLLPSFDDIEFIEVRDDIPISAFGYPVPLLKSDEFSLPWFDLDKREREEKNSSRHKKR